MIGREGGRREGSVGLFYTSPSVILVGAIRRGFEEFKCPDEGRAAAAVS